jgi:hypothetical protein
VAREFGDLVRDFLKDELDRFCLDALDALLHDMVPVLVLNAAHDAPLELRDEKQLLVPLNRDERFLNDAAAVDVEREVAAVEEVRGIVKDVRGSESICEQDSRKM